MEEILSEELVQYALPRYRRTLRQLGERAGVVSGYVDGLAGEEKLLMEFLYGTMPLCDAADYEPGLIHRYVGHGLFLRREKEWTRRLPEDIFLNYVLHYRVNNEDITDCREWFYRMLLPLTEGCSQEEVVKQVNCWCACQAAYAASDARTLGPAAVFYSGSGRCGEESTFLVSTLRSVGIAARQVYTPRWAHCDDNHAWVEAWVEGRWRFLGACEPEAVLDRGWFTHASSRAMLVHTRAFSDYQGRDSGRREEITARDGAAVLYNDTSFYARTGYLEVEVRDGAGRPLSNGKVSFELLNEAAYTPIAVGFTDKEGRAGMTLGLGTVQIHVAKDGIWDERIVENRGDTREKFILSGEKCRQTLERHKHGWTEIDHIAPEDSPMHLIQLTEEQKERGKLYRQRAAKRRGQKLEELKGTQELERHPSLRKALRREPRLLRILDLSFGNAPEICRFLEKYPRQEAVALLETLAEKDYRDIRAEVLEDHYLWGKKVQEFSLREYLLEAEDPQELFRQYVWNPRIRYERITPYRSWLMQALDPKQKQEFQRKPEEIWRWIQDTFGEQRERDYHPVVTSPAGVMQLGKGSLESKRTLFVAVCRTLGIPARIDPVDQEAEFYCRNSFRSVENPAKEKDRARLILESQGAPVYHGDWTIGRLKSEDGDGDGFPAFETLDLRGREFREGRFPLMLPGGIYRLITTVRLPNGDQMEARRILDTSDFIRGTDGVPELTIPLLLRRPGALQMLVDLPLEEFALLGKEGQEVAAGTLVSGKTILAFVEEGAEPTEHFLNELREQGRELAAGGLHLILVTAGREALENPTLAAAVRELGAEVFYDDFTELPETLARRMYTGTEKLPLVLLIDQDFHGRYASSGYNVGSVGMLLRAARLLKG